MSYRATVLTVMIASPFDVGAERDAVEAAIHDWNVSNAASREVVLLPWRWEKNAVPQLGGHPQALINAQGVDQSDIVVAMFAGRIGKATAEAISGTAEEVTRARDAGKPVHLFFSNGSIPAGSDPEQLAALQTFKGEMETAGLYGEFTDPADLAAKVRRALDYDVTQMPEVTSSPAETAAAPAVKPVDFIAQPGEERLPNGVSRGGQPKWTMKHWADVTNVGTEDAYDVRYRAAGERTPMFLHEEGTRVFPAGQKRRIGYTLGMGGGDRVIRVTWTRDGVEESKDLFVG
jgi:hypothetical protein